jgi:hypothetical protein
MVMFRLGLKRAIWWWVVRAEGRAIMRHFGKGREKGFSVAHSSAEALVVPRLSQF